MDFPAWFFEQSRNRVPVVVTRFLPYQPEGSATVHWKLMDGKLYMSLEAFAELKRVAG